MRQPPSIKRYLFQTITIQIYPLPFLTVPTALLKRSYAEAQGN